MSDDFLKSLFEALKAKKDADPAASYTAQLYSKDTEKIAQKVGEEAVELVIEAMKLETAKTPEARDNFCKESADLLYHWLVLCAHLDINPQDVFTALQNRSGTSGLQEKASRSRL